MTKRVTSRPLPDVKPVTPVARLDRTRYAGSPAQVPIEDVAAVVGMSKTFVRRALGASVTAVTADQVLELLDQDAYAETFVRRSQVLDYLFSPRPEVGPRGESVGLADRQEFELFEGDALDLIPRMAAGSVDCVVTSTPYWAMRVYKASHFVTWADGEVCPYGHEQTPEGFIRHTTELLYRLMPVLADHGSIWWNVMDTFNTRTQIRGNAAEALRAMQGHDRRAWAEHESRRYSAGHAYLKDGEQCQIPPQIAARASRLGYYVKSTITWAKPYTTPEPQNSRVSRSLEYVLHLSKHRTPRFSRDAYRQLPPTLGGRNTLLETDKLLVHRYVLVECGVDRRRLHLNVCFSLIVNGRRRGLVRGQHVLDHPQEHRRPQLRRGILEVGSVQSGDTLREAGRQRDRSGVLLALEERHELIGIQRRNRHDREPPAKCDAESEDPLRVLRVVGAQQAPVRPGVEGDLRDLAFLHCQTLDGRDSACRRADVPSQSDPRAIRRAQSAELDGVHREPGEQRAKDLVHVGAVRLVQ